MNLFARQRHFSPFYSEKHFTLKLYHVKIILSERFNKITFV